MQSGVLAGGWLLHQSMLRAFATEFHGEKIRVAIIGCGDRATGLMKTILSMPEEFEVVAICDVLDFRLEKASKIGGSPRLKQYRDYRKLLDDKQVQAVLIATPLNLHYINAVVPPVTALDAGWDFLVMQE